MLTSIKYTPKFEKSTLIDNNLWFLLKSIKQRYTGAQDDYRLLIIGDTGSGKSILGICCVHEYLEGLITVDNVALHIPDFFDKQARLYKQKLKGNNPYPAIQIDEHAERRF